MAYKRLSTPMPMASVRSYGNDGGEFNSDLILFEHDIKLDQRRRHINLQLLELVIVVMVIDMAQVLSRYLYENASKELSSCETIEWLRHFSLVGMQDH